MTVHGQVGTMVEPADSFNWTTLEGCQLHVAVTSYKVRARNWALFDVNPHFNVAQSIANTVAA
jgi:hypothetical protein